MAVNVKMDQQTASSLMELTKVWVNAALVNNGSILLDATKRMAKILDEFDKKHGTDEFQIDLKMREAAINAAAYGRDRQQYLLRRSI